MNKLMMVSVVAMSAAAINAATVEQVIVRQQWPWSTDIKVEYRLSGVTSAQDITVMAYDGDRLIGISTGSRNGVLARKGDAFVNKSFPIEYSDRFE